MPFIYENVGVVVSCQPTIRKDSQSEIFKEVKAHRRGDIGRRSYLRNYAMSDVAIELLEGTSTSLPMLDPVACGKVRGRVQVGRRI